MTTQRANFVSGVVDNNPLAAGGLTLNSTSLANLPTVSGSDVAYIVLGYDTVAPEIVKVTAHTASASSATIVRAQRGTSAAAWAQNTKWIHAGTKEDFAYVDTANNFTQTQQVTAPALNVWGTDTGVTPFYVNAPAGHGTLILSLDVDGQRKFQVQQAGGVSAVGQSHNFGRGAVGADNAYTIVGDDAFGAAVTAGHGTAANTQLTLISKGTGKTVLAGSNGTQQFAVDNNGCGFYLQAPQPKQTVTGSRGGNAVVQSLVNALNAIGLITDSTTA